MMREVRMTSPECAVQLVFVVRILLGKKTDLIVYKDLKEKIEIYARARGLYRQRWWVDL